MNEDKKLSGPFIGLISGTDEQPRRGLGIPQGEDVNHELDMLETSRSWNTSAWRDSRDPEDGAMPSPLSVVTPNHCESEEELTRGSHAGDEREEFARLYVLALCCAIGTVPLSECRSLSRSGSGMRLGERSWHSGYFDHSIGFSAGCASSTTS